MACLFLSNPILCLPENPYLMDLPLQKNFRCPKDELFEYYEPFSKILVISPSFKNLPNHLFLNNDNIPQEKKYSYPITQSRLISKTAEGCNTFIELPIMFEDYEMLEQRNFKRCSIGPLFKSTFFIIVTRLFKIEKRNAYG